MSQEQKQTIESAKQEAIDDIATESVPRHKLPLRYFDVDANGTTRLVNTQNDGELKVRNSTNRVKFEQPAIVSTVRIYSEGFPDDFELPVTYYDILKSRNINLKCKQTLDSNGDKAFIFRPMSWVGEISFRPTRGILLRRNIKRIDIYGFEEEAFESALDAALNVEKRKRLAISDISQNAKSAQDLIDREAELTEILTETEQELSTVEQDLEDKKKAVQQLQLKESELDQNISAKTTRNSQLTEENSRLGQSIEEQKSDSTVLGDEIREKSKELKELNKNIDIFPLDFKGYVEQGGKNIQLYIALSVIPLILIAIVTTLTFYGGVELSTVYERVEEPDLRTMFFTRLPFSLIMIAILTVCYKFAKIFMNEIVRVNQQRLNLTKLSIIAKDINEAATHNLNFSEEEEYELRTHLKMQMLRQYLKPYLGENYNYDISPSLFSLFKERKATLSLPFLNRKKAKVEISTNATGDIEVDVNAIDEVASQE